MACFSAVSRMLCELNSVHPLRDATRLTTAPLRLFVRRRAEMQVNGVPFEATGNQPFMNQYGGNERCVPWSKACAIESVGVIFDPLT
jgi:hypothetical protein